MAMNGDALASVSELFDTAPKRRFKEVVLPVSGHRVRIQSLTEREVSEFQAAMLAKKGQGLRKDKLIDANRRLIALCLVDQDGNRFVTDRHMRQMANWDSADTSTLYGECTEHCGLDPNDVPGAVKNPAGESATTDDDEPPCD